MKLTCKLKFDWDSILSSVQNEGVTCPYPALPVLRSFSVLFPVSLSLNTDRLCACASHVTPSFRTDERIESGPIKLQVTGKSNLIL